MTELASHLERLGLEQYLVAFIGEGFDTWETVLDIQESDFDALNVKLGHRRKLQRAIAEYRGIPYERLIASSTHEAASDSVRASEGAQGPPGTGAVTAGAETKRKYRRHPKPDENAPERPPSAYVIFSNKVREEVKDQNLSFTQIAKLVGDRWQKLDPAGKEPYEAQANAAKEKYNILLSTYKKTESYREYSQYLTEFKAKHGGGVEQKRPRLEPASSGGSVSGKSLEVDAELLVPSQGHNRGSSTGSLSYTVMPSPAGSQGPPPTHIPVVMGTTSLRDVSPRSTSPPQPLAGRDLPRLGQLSTQSSLSDESLVIRSDSDPLVRTASLSLSTPPTGTPPLPPPPPSSAGSDHGLGQDISRLRYPGTSLQTGPGVGTQIGSQGGVGHPFPATLPSPSISEASLRSRGPDLRNYFDIGRSIPPASYFTSGATPGTISLPPITGGADRIGGMATQRVLPLPRSSPTSHQQPAYPLGSRATESPNPYRQGQSPGYGSAPSPLERSESDAADALAGLAGFSSASRPDTAKPWDPHRGWPHR